MKTVVVFVVYVLFCSFASCVLGGVAFDMFVAVNLKPSNQAHEVMFGVYLLIVLSGPVVGLVCATLETRKRKSKRLPQPDDEIENPYPSL
jgi:hypothetical protein